MDYYEPGDSDHTKAFERALAANRLVYVPEGNYILSDNIYIHENCELELAQSAVLRFTQTDKNCITLLRLASLKGNHATIFVPYDFTASVIYASTTEDRDALSDTDGDGNLYNENYKAVPPFTHWDPQWKMSRYVTDINICKFIDSGDKDIGCHYSKTGDTNGTAVTLECHLDGLVKFMHGVNFSGIRIAGAFEYGIYIWNEDDGKTAWNHDMRIEAVIDACKVGLYAKGCNTSHFAVTFQPRSASNGSVYAENGIILKDCKHIDLSSACIWDWYEGRTKYEFGNSYQHIALLGECKGLILSDYLYYESAYGEAKDIRNFIYTDNPSNLEKMTILQEPVTKWFKVKEGRPYCTDNNVEKELALKTDFEDYFAVDAVKEFTDALPGAKDKDGNLCGEYGYRKDVTLNSNGDHINSGGNYHCTGLIPCKKGDIIYVEGIDLIPGLKDQDNDSNGDGYPDGDGQVRFVLLKANLEKFINCNHGNVRESYFYGHYYKTNNGFRLELPNYDELNDVAFIRFAFYKTGLLTEKPMISVNKPIEYTMSGFLSDGVKVKAENVVGNINTENPDINLDKYFKTEETTNDILADVGYVWGELLRNTGLTTSDPDMNHGCTGFIACETGDKIYGVDIFLNKGYSNSDGYPRLVVYDENKEKIAFINHNVPNEYVAIYKENNTGFELEITQSGVKYIRFGFHRNCIGENPMISVNEELKTSTTGFLADDIKVTISNFIGNIGSPKRGILLPKSTLNYMEEYEIHAIFDPGFAFEGGKSYTVTLDGIEYVCKSQSFITDTETMIAIGDCTVFGVQGVQSNDEPFVMFISEGALACMMLDGTTDPKSIQIEGDIVKKLDKEAMPYHVIAVTDENKLGGSSTVFTVNGDAYEFYEILRSGIPIYIDLSSVRGYTSKVLVTAYTTMGETFDVMLATYGSNARAFLCGTEFSLDESGNHIVVAFNASEF